MFIRKEEFNEVKIIPSILVYILLSFGVSFILLFVNREVLNNNANAVQVIIDFSFILFLKLSSFIISYIFSYPAIFAHSLLDVQKLYAIINSIQS